jgi:predicted ATP-grasp superfamily ATP-dependent carboligase
MPEPRHQRNRPAAVVIGNHTQGLGVVRSAGVAGWPAWVVNDKALSLVRFSRYLTGYRRVCRGTLGSLADLACAEHLIEALLDLPVENGSLLLGVDEDITCFVFRSRSRLGAKYHIPDVRLDRIYDKYLFNSLLPHAARIETRLYSDGRIHALDRVDDFVVKGRQGNAFRRVTGTKAMTLARFVEFGPELVFREVDAEHVIVQRLITSDRPIVSVCSFCVNGRIQVAFQYEKLRQHPDRFGTGTYLRSVAVAGIQDIAAEVLCALAFTGISEIEFVWDSASRTYRIIEMNPRTWKSTHFATQCGANLVDAYMTYVSSGQCKPIGTYAVNRYWADLATDIPQMIRDRTVGGYQRGFFESSWNSVDPVPGVAFWTLFPLLALDQWRSATRTRGPSMSSR